MLKTKVFTSGNSQAVRIPKEFQIKDKEMYITKVGSSLILTSSEDPWELFSAGLDMFPEGFMADGRNQPGMQKRKPINKKSSTF